ncbi:MAG TPA: alpha/beta hydrolase [Candidatus Tectomicrobia bacterium]|jgi:pimeloyl-ACP methyl ester carboxylesterase
MPHMMVNGFCMYYAVDGAGIPLLFVHGGLGGGRGSANFCQHHMAKLTPYARVIAFDRRAAGRSETPVAGYSFTNFVADIFALLDALGHQRAVLMGTSAGGPQVLQAALTHPERVLALILGSTATQTVRVPSELTSLITFLGTDGLAQFQAMLARHAPGEAANTTAMGTVPGRQLGGVLQTYLAYHLHGDPIAARLHEIMAPVLILHGTYDTEVPFVEAEHLYAGLPVASLIPFVGGGHSIMVTHAAAYCQAIVSFLRSLPAT